MLYHPHRIVTVFKELKCQQIHIPYKICKTCHCYILTYLVLLLIVKTASLIFDKSTRSVSDLQSCKGMISHQASVKHITQHISKGLTNSFISLKPNGQGIHLHRIRITYQNRFIDYFFSLVSKIVLLNIA